MYIIKIFDKNNKQKYKIDCVEIAETFKGRLTGLMFKEEFTAMLFKQKYSDRLSGSIHTCFMKVPIDIIYINTKLEIQEIATLDVWKLYIPKKCNIQYIIELPQKTCLEQDIKVGDKAVIENEKT